MLFLSFLLSLTIFFAQWVDASDYTEQLSLHPLPDSALLAAFNFRSSTTASSFEEQNFRFFPRSLGQILQHTHTKEVHLRFSLGRWDAEAWGARPRGGRREGGTGVELWAWIDAPTDEEANARWLTLTNALSGLFCASMNFIDATNTIRPISTFSQEGSHSQNSSKNLHLLHGALPHEVVCTENLTPFLKLLPCKGKAGISSLLDGHKLFDASWQTMAIDVRPVCPNDGSECLLEIEQTVDMVLDVERSMRPSHDPIPRPPPIESIACDTSKPYNGFDTCFPLDRGSQRAWSLKEVFGRPIRGACPLAGPQSETVHLQVPAERDVRIESGGKYSERMSGDGTIRHYGLPIGSDFDLALSEDSLVSKPTLPQSRLFASRAFTGYGQERGGMRTVLTNPSLSSTASIVYLESLPWFMKPYLHTLHASIRPLDASATNETATGIGRSSPITSISYRPAIDRKRGTHLELSLTISPNSAVTLTYEFEKAILRYTEYPPDANRGFDVAPAIIRVLPLPMDDEAGDTYLRTTSLLLPLPTPDFSMPYNVIILTSTVIAMGFGSVFNLLVRRFVGADEMPASGLAVVRERVRAAVVRLKNRPGGKVKVG